MSIEWASAAEESDVIADSLGNGHALPVDILEEAQDSAVNRSTVSSVLSPHPPLGVWDAGAALTF